MSWRFSTWTVEQRLGAAVAASLAVHAAAMSLSFPAARVWMPEPTRALEVSFREPAPPPVVAPDPAGSVPAAPVPEKRRPEPRKPAAVQLLRRSEPPAPAASDDEQPVKAAVPEATPAPTPQAQPAPPLATLQAATPGPSQSDLLMGYGHAISRALAPYKEYPPIALMQGWQGAVTMRLRVAPSGRLIDAEVHSSSGHEVLDRQALAMASKPDRFPAPPEGLRDREIAVLVPVVFRLER